MNNSNCKKVSRILGVSIGLTLFITFSVFYKELFWSLWNIPFNPLAFYSLSLYFLFLSPTLIGFMLGKIEKLRYVIIINVFIAIIGFFGGVIIFSSYYLAFCSISLYCVFLIPTLVGFILGELNKLRFVVTGNVLTGIICFIVGVLIFAGWYI